LDTSGQQAEHHEWQVKTSIEAVLHLTQIAFCIFMEFETMVSPLNGDFQTLIATEG